MKKVIVEQYTPEWKTDFEAIRAELAASLGDTAVSIEHVGSTSVPGLCAKPIIDIDIIIQDMSVFGEAADRLTDLGYTHEGDLGIPGREAFKYSGKPHLRKHHLYVCAQDSPELHRHITFRDYLRTHPEAAERYGAVKEEAARLFPDDMDGYIRHKAPVIEEIYSLCGLK